MSDPRDARPARRRVGRIVAATLIVAAIALAGVRVLRTGRGHTGAGTGSVAPVTRVIPEGTRIKVELLNATDTRGLARIAAGVLRDAGFDVVYYGNTPERHDSTVVRDRSNHPDWARLAAQVLGPALLEVRADSGRLVDLTVLVGRGWRPPTESLRP